MPKILNPNKDYPPKKPKTKIGKLKHQLAHIKMDWVKTKNKIYVFKFKTVYLQLRSLGWRGTLDEMDEAIFKLAFPNSEPEHNEK